MPHHAAIYKETSFGDEIRFLILILTPSGAWTFLNGRHKSKADAELTAIRHGYTVIELPATASII